MIGLAYLNAQLEEYSRLQFVVESCKLYLKYAMNSVDPAIAGRHVVVTTKINSLSNAACTLNSLAIDQPSSIR